MRRCRWLESFWSECSAEAENELRTALHQASILLTPLIFVLRFVAGEPLIPADDWVVLVIVLCSCGSSGTEVGWIVLVPPVGLVSLVGK